VFVAIDAQFDAQRTTVPMIAPATVPTDREGEVDGHTDFPPVEMPAVARAAPGDLGIE
jgi:hypothetical protein